ncbi:hypothetical protein WAI453_009688 [Rhynchosporium graminicola]
MHPISSHFLDSSIINKEEQQKHPYRGCDHLSIYLCGWMEPSFLSDLVRSLLTFSMFSWARAGRMDTYITPAAAPANEIGSDPRIIGKRIMKI